MAGKCAVTMVMMMSIICVLRDQTGVSSAPVEPAEESDGMLQYAEQVDKLRVDQTTMRETMTAFKGMMNTIRQQVHDNSKRILTIERKYKESQGRLEDDIVKTMDPKVLALDGRLEAVLNTTNENTEAVLSNKNESSQMLRMVNSISLRVGSVENRTVSLAQEQEDLRANSPCGACRAALTEEIVSTVMSRLQEAREWPTGTYGLPRTNTGCPEPAGVTWRTGVRKHDTEDDDASNQWTHGLHFDGGFWRGDMLQKFCMKTISSDGSGSWPSGSYCVFKKSSCPPGFQSGELFWDDEDDDNGNYRSGVLPDGIYNGNTLIRYCCRNDGSASSPISLPTGSPFYLFRYRQGCQRVDEMNVREEFFRWDDEDDDNKNRRQGAYPYDDGGSRDHRLHYCYYS